MKKALKIALIVVLSLLVIYLLLCLNLTHRIKKYTDSSYGLYPYEKNTLVMEDDYYKLSPLVVIDIGKRNDTIIWDEEVSNEEYAEYADEDITYEMKRVDYDWIGISYAYFDFSRGGIVVVTPFDYSAEYDDGHRHGTMQGSCDRKVTIKLHGGLWRVTDISTECTASK